MNNLDLEDEDEFIVVLKYRVLDPEEIKSKDGKFVCVVSAFIKQENTKVGDDATILLSISKHDTYLECQDWAKAKADQLNAEKWYLVDEHYKILSDILNDECLAILDEEKKNNEQEK